MITEIQESVKYLKSKGIEEVHTGIILGTGLGGLVKEIDISIEIPYGSIPNFPNALIEFHKGKLIYGKLAGKTVLAFQGRFHYYEGHTMNKVVYPVRVLAALHAKQVLISNAAGNMNPQWKKGELMLITDHINLQPDNPLRDRNAASFGNIFVDMSAPYSSALNATLIQKSKELGIKLNQGVYVAVMGPNLETRAEYKFLRMIGADAVGMSTVPEVIAANQQKLPVAAISVLTDDCDPENLKPVVIEDILEVARNAEKSLISLFKSFLEL